MLNLEEYGPFEEGFLHGSPPQITSSSKCDEEE
jgi:hypothetical protein